MVIHINPSRINTTPAAQRKGRDSSQRPEGGDYTTPKRADVNHIPEPESLATLIRSAISSLRSGIFWDRGTILNLVV